MRPIADITRAKIREKLPDAEFILVAAMLGNLNGTCRPEVDLYALKQDWDQIGNGVNHPNDFGHRVYAQVITALLITTQ